MNISNTSLESQYNFPSAGKPNLVIGITGASGVILGIRLLEALNQFAIETHLVISSAAHLTIVKETNWQVKDVLNLADVTYKHNDIGADIASGSFDTIGMIVIPCSIKTLSGIANSYADDLIVRAADVTLKEGRPLILVVRETPLHRGHIRLMGLAADNGAIIFPPVPSFYTHPQSLDDIINNLIGRILVRLGINNTLYKRWQNDKP